MFQLNKYHREILEKSLGWSMGYQPYVMEPYWFKVSFKFGEQIEFTAKSRLGLRRKVLKFLKQIQHAQSIQNCL